MQIADMLPCKTASSTKQIKLTTCSHQISSSSASLKDKSSTHTKKKSCKVTVEEVEDEDSPQNISVHNHATSPNPPNPPAVTETMMGDTEQRKKVCTLMPHSTPLTMHAPQKPGEGKHSIPIYLFWPSLCRKQMLWYV